MFSFRHYFCRANSDAEIPGLLSTEDSEKFTGESLLVPIDRRTLVQTANLITTLAVASLSLIKWLILGSGFMPISGIIITVLGVCNGIYLLMGGAAIVAARFIIVVFILGLGYGSFNTGGFDGPVVLLAPIIPILSFLLIGPRTGWVAAVAMVLSLLVVLALHLVGAVPPSPHAEHVLIFARFVALASTGVIATWVIWTFAVAATALGQRNKFLANTDHLTGIANRRFSEKLLDQEILRARRSGQDLSLIISDVDLFKRYNDANGHQAGDECLQRVAGIMKHNVRRPADMVGRFGGEEFIAVLPETNSDGAFAIAERMRQALLDEHMPYEPGKPEMVSMTLGVTSSPGKKIDSASDMIRLADRALYQGKEQGRNTVVMNLPSG
jgi:diguanylate cyclase (GGDEF)-like protein